MFGSHHSFRGRSPACLVEIALRKNGPTAVIGVLEQAATQFGTDVGPRSIRYSGLLDRI